MRNYFYYPKRFYASEIIFKRLNFLFLLILANFNVFAQVPAIQWDKTIGGSNTDELLIIKQTVDNGYILGGYSSSNISGDKTENCKGASDYWVVKLDANGIKQWDKTIGGNNHDLLISLQQTADHGYILGGYSFSNISADKTENSKGSYDYWVVKLDADGTKQWDKTIGGNDFEVLTDVQQTADYGYILGGYSLSNISGDKTENGKGGSDYWVVKLDVDGTKQWDRTIGGNETDRLFSLQQTMDNGYILGGLSFSNYSGDKTENSKGASDYWVVKIDANGIKQWDKTIGGTNQDQLSSVQQTSDNDYILGGYSLSNISGDKTENSKGGVDYWIVKIDVNGIKQWDKTIGGNNHEELKSIQQTSDNGYILGGYSLSNISEDKTENSKGGADYWVVKIDANGTKQWDKTIGGENDDVFRSLQQTADNSYILGGQSSSNISGDKTENSKGSIDYWVVKLEADNTPSNLTLNSPEQVSLCFKSSQSYDIPFLEITGDLGIESITYIVYPFPTPYYFDENCNCYVPAISRSGTGLDASGIFWPGESKIVWIVNDVSGNSHYCETFVRVNPEINLSIADVFAVNPGGAANTIYLGYGPSSLTLTSQTTGGSPYYVGGNIVYNYQWELGTTQLGTDQSLIVGPNVAGTYNYNLTVTDASGCTAEFTKTIKVVDIWSDKKKTKMYICHRDSRGTWTQLSILTGSVANHLVHGDYLGICNNNSSTSEILTSAASEIGDHEIIQNGFKIYPNPATNFLDVQWSTKNTSQISIRILNAEGKTVKTITTQGAVNQQRISLNGLAKGVYMLVLKTGSVQQVSKFVIQ